MSKDKPSPAGLSVSSGRWPLNKQMQIHSCQWDEYQGREWDALRENNREDVVHVGKSGKVS